MKEVRRFSAKKLETVFRDWNFLNRWNDKEREEFYTKYDCEILGHRTLLKISKVVIDASDRHWNGLQNNDKIDFVASLIASECVTSYITF